MSYLQRWAGYSSKDLFERWRKNWKWFHSRNLLLDRNLIYHQALGIEQNRGKIVLHLLFGLSLDKHQKSLDQSKQILWQFGSIRTKTFPNPDQPPLELFLIYQYFCTKHKIIDNEKWKLLETLHYTIKEFNNGIMWSVQICIARMGLDGGEGARKGLLGFVVALFVHVQMGNFSF